MLRELGSTTKPKEKKMTSLKTFRVESSSGELELKFCLIVSGRNSMN